MGVLFQYEIFPLLPHGRRTGSSSVPRAGFLLRQTPTQYSNKTPSPFCVPPGFSYWVKGKNAVPSATEQPHDQVLGQRNALAERSNIQRHFCVGRYAAGAAFIYLFATSRFHQRPGQARKRATERQRAGTEKDIFFLSGNAAKSLSPRYDSDPKSHALN